MSRSRRHYYCTKHNDKIGNINLMEPYKFTTIAHSDRVFCSPLSESKVARILERIELLPKERVIDVDFGKVH
jgi:hypothetical protein